jgi:hypothetical protein
MVGWLDDETQTLFGLKKKIDLETEDAALSPTRLDGENEHERNTKSDSQPDGDRNELQGDLEPSQVRCG